MNAYIQFTLHIIDTYGMSVYIYVFVWGGDGVAALHKIIE
jgi:hypothetical protein